MFYMISFCLLLMVSCRTIPNEKVGDGGGGVKPERRQIWNRFVCHFHIFFPSHPSLCNFFVCFPFLLHPKNQFSQAVCWCVKYFFYSIYFIHIFTLKHATVGIHSSGQQLLSKSFDKSELQQFSCHSEEHRSSSFRWKNALLCDMTKTKYNKYPTSSSALERGFHLDNVFILGVDFGRFTGCIGMAPSSGSGLPRWSNGSA